MNLGEAFPVSPGKVSDLLARIARLGLKAELIEESFARGGGKGGQKRNKTSNAVRLAYPPLGLETRAGRERSRSLNRFLALRELVDRAEALLSPGTSRRLREIEKLKKRKARKAERTAAKYGQPE